jgi:oligoendopeptidase F
MTYAASQRWDLETIFKNGPGGDAFLGELATLTKEVEATKQRLTAAGELAVDPEFWSQFLQEIGSLRDKVGTVGSFAHCHWSADANSAEALAASANTSELNTSFQGLFVPLKAILLRASDDDFARFVARPELDDIAPMLQDIRNGAHLLLPEKQQALFLDLEREALHGWGQLYGMISGKLSAPIALDGREQTLSIAALSGLKADPDPTTREKAFRAHESAWEGVSDLCAHTLTQITGARITRNNRLGIDELAHTLNSNRISSKTLDAIMEACSQLQKPLQQYLFRKAKLLGKEKLDWWDLNAPISGGALESISWDRAQELVVNAFEGFDPKLQRFAKSALEKQWVEAEARKGKRPGGYCTRVPTSGESRIYMSFTNTLNSTMTLAHELGHAYHNHILFDQSTFKMRITSALAETASTFAEAIVLDRVLSAAEPDLRLFLIEQQLQRGTSFLMNIPSRYALERRLYALRSEGVLSKELLSKETIRCQKEAYGDALNSYDPTFWCSKLHFYISHFGFYNWPYTFGYLFSAAVYQRFKSEGSAFIPTFEDLLRKTGYRWSEPLAAEVLGEDIETAAFWLGATAPLEKHIHAFLALTDDVVH